LFVDEPVDVFAVSPEDESGDSEKALELLRKHRAMLEETKAEK